MKGTMENDTAPKRPGKARRVLRGLFLTAKWLFVLLLAILLAAGLIFKAPWVPRGRGWKLQDPVMGIFSHTFANVAILAVLDRQLGEADLFGRK